MAVTKRTVIATGAPMPRHINRHPGIAKTARTVAVGLVTDRNVLYLVVCWNISK